MQINVLQSLIDRTSNQIAEYESFLRFYKSENAKRGLNETDIRYAISNYSGKLPKLREIQKALKKEIAKEIERQRSIEQFFTRYNAYPKECFVY